MKQGIFHKGAAKIVADNGLTENRCSQSYGSTGYKALEALQRYWNELLWRRREESQPSQAPWLVPLRSAFNPMKIHRHLPDIFIAERKSAGNLWLRISGTAIDEAAGFCLQGKNFFDICLSSERDFFKTTTGAMLKQPCGMKLTRRIMLPDGRAYKYNALCFPLADSEAVPRYIVGMVKVAADNKRAYFRRTSKIRSEMSGFSYIDIGAGMPAAPTAIR